MRSATVRKIIRAYDDPLVRAYCWARFWILRQRFLDEIGQYLPAEGAVLDLGCGFGLFSLYYAATGPRRFLRGIDVNARRIALARRAAARLGIDNVAYEVADARHFKGDGEVGAAYMLDIVHGTSLCVDAGEIVSIIGPNGAGKSTAFKTIVGFLHPRGGTIRFNGEDITGLRPDLVLRRGLAYVPQGRIVFPQMTVLENLEMGAYIDRDRTRVTQALEQVYTLFPILRERRRQKAGTMSGGEQQMVAIGRALMTSPTLILLDEPSLGLSPKFVTLIFEKLVEMKDAGVTLMLVEQNAARALAIADRGYVLELGRNRFEGAGPRLLADPEVKRLYLGG